MAEPCFLNQATKRDIEKLPVEDVQVFWRYAKQEGLFKGLNPDETRSMIAEKFNVPERVVSWLLDRNKTARMLSEEARVRQKQTAGFLANNRRWLTDFDKTGVEKLWSLMQGGTRRTLLAYHGPVPPVTHALDVLVTNPIKFLRMYGRGVASVFPKYADRVMATLEKQPYYDEALKSGLPIGKEDISTEGFPSQQSWARRAMDAALKPLRYELWEAKWKRILQNSPEDATPEMAKKLSFEYAHATGATVRGEAIERLTRGVRQAALAPQLTISKIAKTLFDPIETVKTFERTLESKITDRVRAPTPEERIVAWNRVQRAARWLGGTLGALAINNAFLKYHNSQQQINYDDPTRGDWMAFKFGGHMYRMRGTMEIIALVAKLAALGRQKYKYGQQTPEEAVARYGEYKLTPGISLTKELTTGKDIFGRPVPWSSEPGSERFPRKNVMEFVGEHGPIFVGHAISALHESLRDQGVDTRVSMNVIRAITQNPTVALKAAEEAALSGGAEFFGVNIQPDRYVGKPTGAPPPSRSTRPRSTSTVPRVTVRTK